ncbi:uncharacterized protein N7443_001745 [Penicillium atrosanguineum]|uniref:uncharacterized protein n=1 Tax=Penicillium atrosanguineum TaxID=1132637 RepID=UPI002399FA89|nr:uncharacterized protein N7443_001745 [Penicillium atrosanguineum]KAJ5117911.1 hypothetical protein N7526_010934 [Penicillium atrosanguineum]KAJ5309284.1 hypothetical protein N7443_001745 [Penicillium atrosanguineum]
MKRSRLRRNRKLESDCGGDDLSATTPSDSEQGDATYETDSTELEDAPSSPKRLRLDENLVLEPEIFYDAGELYDDPLDEGGVDLSEIPEDFDKAPGTIERRERIESRWKRYCASQVRKRPNDPKWRKVEEALRQASNNDMYRFLRWCLQLERGEDGRHIKGINKASTLETDWKNLRCYYQKLTKIVINDEDGSEIRRGMKYLVQEFGLDTQPGRKTPVYIEDIGPFNETILSTQEKKFHLGFQRIQVCLFNSLGIFTVHRKSALLSLQFKDLQISLQKDPRGGPPVPMIELTPEGTKKFLGLTKLTTFALPEIVYGPSLVICPHTLLFGILFHARAFRNQGLTSKAQLRKLFISKGCEQLLVPLDPKKSGWYVFCKTELVKGVPTIQRTTQMSKSVIATLLVTFGEIRGWKGAFHAHQFRYGSGKVINESGWVSKEQHMLIMKHASPRTFLNHYHPLQLDTDMIRVICGLDPDVELMRAVTRQSRWRDTRRPRYLTDQQRAQVEDHPELEDARRNLSKIRAQYEETQQSGLLLRLQQREKEVRNTRKRLHRSLRHQIRERFDEEQAFLDIEAQLSGTVVKEDSEDKSSLEDTMHPLQLHLVQSLLSYPVSNSLEGEWHRRDTGTAAVVQYCDVLEGGPLRGRPKQKAPRSAPLAGRTAQPQGLHQTKNDFDSCVVPVSIHGKPLRATKEYLETAKQPEACFQCFANEGLPDDVRFRMFHDAGCVTRHFDTTHLDEKPLECNWCEVALLHKMAFQRHAIDAHGQNVIMKHADSRTFLNHYLPRHVDTDMQNVMNGHESKKSLMRAITRRSRWIDTRRPRHLTAEQRTSIREHPYELMRLRHDKLAREKLNTFGRLERALRQKVRREFDRRQAKIDIERQLSGAAIDDEEVKDVLRTNSGMPAPSDEPGEEPTVVEVRTAKTTSSVSPEMSQEELLLEKAAKYIRKAKKPRRCFQRYGDTQLPVHRRP